ncbi:MAG: amino acid ABC transporter substrate-binding protein [Cyanobacteria bacterium J06639_1]
MLEGTRVNVNVRAIAKNKLVKTLLGLALLLPLASCGVFAKSSGIDEPGAGRTLARIRDKRILTCGSNSQLPGFGKRDELGNYSGFDVDICRAIAAAVFGVPDVAADGEDVEYVYLQAADRKDALAAGTIDVMSRNTTWTLTRDRDWQATYGPTTYYDGQGFMVRQASGIQTVADLNGRSVCVIRGTTTEANLEETFAARNLALTSVKFDDNDASASAYDRGECDALTSDQSTLISRRSTMGNPGEHAILSETISKEPLGPLVKQGDSQWADVVRWTVNALIYAEEMGITSKNVEEMRSSSNPEIRRFLGAEGNLGELLDVEMEPDWAYAVISTVGNYGEIFERNLGPLGVERGLNQPHAQGGIMYAQPFR